MSKKKRHQYGKINLVAAIRAVSRGHNFSSTARLYGIPKTTLCDHTKGHLTGSSRGPGRELSLNHEEEQALINYIKYMAERGC